MDDLILPLFAIDGKNIKNPIASMPGHFQLSVDNLVKTAREAHQLGIPAVILFGVPDRKDPLGTAAYAETASSSGRHARSRTSCPDLVVITDVCLCEYTDHGHCGVRRERHASTTTPPWTCWPAPRCPMPRPGPTWWRHRT